MAGEAGTEGRRIDAAGAGVVAGATGLSGGDDASSVCGASVHQSSLMGVGQARAKQVDNELHEQLDLLAGLTYPNSSIRYIL